MLAGKGATTHTAGHGWTPRSRGHHPRLLLLLLRLGLWLWLEVTHLFELLRRSAQDGWCSVDYSCIKCSGSIRAALAGYVYYTHFSWQAIKAAKRCSPITTAGAVPLAQVNSSRASYSLHVCCVLMFGVRRSKPSKRASKPNNGNAGWLAGSDVIDYYVASSYVVPFERCSSFSLSPWAK